MSASLRVAPVKAIFCGRAIKSPVIDAVFTACKAGEGVPASHPANAPRAWLCALVRAFNVKPFRVAIDPLKVVWLKGVERVA